MSGLSSQMKPHHNAPFAISLSLPSGLGGLDITRLLAGPSSFVGIRQLEMGDGWS